MRQELRECNKGLPEFHFYPPESQACRPQLDWGSK